MCYYSHHFEFCGLQNGDRSWAAIQRWDVVLKGEELKGDDYLALHPLIVASLCDHYHQENVDGSFQELDPNNDLHSSNYCFPSMKELFIAIYRRQGGDNMLEMTDIIRKKLRNEFLRLDWPRGKPPESNAW